MVADADELDAAEHGGLVRKILETKKELESGLKEDTDKKGEAPPNKSAGTTTVVFDDNEREKTRKDVAKLQEYIQKLSRTSHPLGRLLDYLQVWGERVSVRERKKEYTAKNTESNKEEADSKKHGRKERGQRERERLLTGNVSWRTCT